MCGRYTLSSPPKTLTAWFELSEPPAALTPRYNIAPTQAVLVVANHGPRTLQLMRWGLVPHWANASSVGNRMINARAETLHTKPAFRDPLRSRRCLIPANGFYEWRREADGSKTPILIRSRSQQPLGLAGLWDEWRAPNGTPLRSCTIVTTQPNAIIAPIHDRMPVILARDDYAQWLTSDEIPPDELMRLLAPAPDGGLETHPVARLVNELA